MLLPPRTGYAILELAKERRARAGARTARVRFPPDCVPGSRDIGIRRINERSIRPWTY